MKKTLAILALGLTAIAGHAATPLWMRDVQISPDGTEIAFCYKGDIYKVPAKGGTATQLTTQESYECTPIWSPDGKQIAFASDRYGNFDVFVMPADGGTAQRLTTHSTGEIPSTFTPDGKYILFSASIQDPASSALFPTSAMTELYKVPATGGRTEQVLGTPAEAVCFDKAGHQFLYQDRKGFEDEWRKHHISSITRDIWLYDAKTGTHTNLTDRAGEDRNPVLSPDGRTVYFLSERNGGSFNVYAFPLAQPREVKPITSFKTHPVRFLSMSDGGTLCYSYDGEIYTQQPDATPKKVAIELVRDDRPQFANLQSSDGATSAVVSPDGKQIAFTLRGEVFVTSADYATTKQVTHTPAREAGLSFATDNRTLAYASERGGNWQLYLAKIARKEDPNFPNATLIEEEVLLPSTTVERAYPQFSPDGKMLAIAASGEAFNKIGLKIAPGQTSNMADGQLFLYDPASKQANPVTKDFNPSVQNFVWNKGDKQIYLQGEDKDCVRLYVLNPSTGKILPIPLKEDILSDFTIAETTPELVYFGESASNSQRLYSVNLKKKSSVCLKDLSAGILKDITLGEVHDWNFRAAAGDTIYGRYYLPPHFDPNKKYPLIVNYYGGTSPTERSLENRYPSHVYAALGYIVYIIQPSGATGFGQEFSARHVNAWGQRTGDEIIEGTKKFCAEHNFVDAKKIGCIGASYGGFMTQYLQTKTDIFAAAISHAGISDITSYWGEGYWGYSYSALASANSYPWNARDMYTLQSPLFNADKINTPILFLHGTVDTNVPVGESIQMFTALKLLGKPTAFVQVVGQNHQILDYKKRAEWNKTIYAWFAKWLKNQPEWWNAMYPEKSL